MSQGSAKSFGVGPIGPTGAVGPTGSIGPIGPTGAQGPAGTTMYAGNCIIDFGSEPGTNVVSFDVTGQTNILTTSTITAFMMSDTTVSGSSGHNSIEHQIAPIKLTVGNVISGVGFTIYAQTDWRLTSTFKVRWLWIQ